jgi:hypothetical protein
MASASQTKRPHFVPACYLRAWSDDKDQVAVRRRGATKVFTPAVVNVAVEAGVYGRASDGQVREEMFEHMENIWPDLRNALLDRGGRLPAPQRDAISVFAALQFIRTRESLAQAEFLSAFAAFSSQRPVSRDAVRHFLTEQHLHFVPTDAEVEGAWTFACVVLNQREPPTKDETMAMLVDVAVHQIGPRLKRMRWTVEHCRKPNLFTSDRPVMCWRPRSARDAYEGIGVDSAEEVRLPLTPRDLLVMRPTGDDAGVQEVQPKRFARVNAGVMSQCHEFLVATPPRSRELELLPVARHRPTLRFNVGPGTRVMPDGREEPMGDIVHMWIPTHAAAARR